MERAIAYFFPLSAEAAILWLYVTHLFTPKKRTSVRLAVLFLIYSVLYALSLLELSLPNVILYFILNYIFFVTQYDIKWNASLFHSATLTAFMCSCEMIMLGIIKSFLPHFMEARQCSNFQLLLFGILNKLLFFIFTCILIYFVKKAKNNETYDNSILLMVVISIFSVFIILIFVYFSEMYTLSLTLNIMIVLCGLLMLTINLLILGIGRHNQKKNAKYVQMQLMLQKESDSAEYYQMLSTQYENQRILVHDVKKHLHSIDLLNEQGQQDKIKEYIEQLILSSDLEESNRLCDHEILNSILMRYMHRCKDKHISLLTDVRNGTVDFIEDTDLTSLFCNLLDNAMESAESVTDSYIEVNVNQRENTNFIVISIINSCPTNPFSHNDQVLISQKSDKNRHGFGLKSIQKTVKKYQGDIQMYYQEETKTFHTIITLKSPASFSV